MVVPAALARLPRTLQSRLLVMQQARPEDVDAVRKLHAANGIAAEIAPFFEDVPARLARAQLVVSRAGASTMAELGVTGRPAILVPFARAADDHQTANARAFVAAGAAWMMAEADFTPALLAEALEKLLAGHAALAAAAAAAHRLGRPDAASRLADLAAAAGGSNGDAPVARERAA